MDKIVPIFHSLAKNMQKIHKLSCEEISVVQSSIIYEISLLTNPSMQLVAETVGMDITTFSRQIKTLQDKKIVVKKAYEKDRRIYILSLTEKGKSLVDLTDVSIESKLKTALSTMSDFERETVIKSIRLFDKKLREL